MAKMFWRPLPPEGSFLAIGTVQSNWGGTIYCLMRIAAFSYSRSPHMRPAGCLCEQPEAVKQDSGRSIATTYSESPHAGNCYKLIIALM
jgi:hypothetical protein